MTAGRKHTLISFETATTTQNEYGEEVPAWGALGDEWAEINWGRGDERRQAAMEQGQQPATFSVYDNPMTRAVTLTDRIVLDGQNWDIESNVPGKRRGDRDITAVRSA